MSKTFLTCQGRRALAAAGLLTALTLGPLWPAGHPTAASAAAPGPESAARGAAALAAPRDTTATATATTSSGTLPTDTPTASATVSGTASATPTATATTLTTPTATATPTETPTSAPTATTTPRPIKPPKPTVHRTNGYQVGTYYFSGWSHGQNDNLTPLLAYSPLRKYEPLLGWYDDSQSLVDQQIVQATNAGINFFAFDWYDVARSRYATDKSLNQALGFYLSSRQRYRMNFCLAFIDQAPFLPRASEWPGLVKTWITYFRQPDYVRVNGKPLFIVFSPEHMREIFGNSKNVRKALDYLRGQVLKAHLPGITIAVGATLTPTFNPGRLGQFHVEGYDVMTGYNYHAMGGEKYRTPAPYKRLVQENEAMWDRVATHLPYPYIPVITSGWDQRFSQREQKTAIIYSGRTPSQFACYAAAARHWIDTHARKTVKERIVLVFAWNEIGEGGQILPTKVDRYAYTDALRHVFTTRQAPVCRS